MADHLAVKYQKLFPTACLVQELEIGELAARFLPQGQIDAELLKLRLRKTGNMSEGVVFKGGLHFLIESRR